MSATETRPLAAVPCLRRVRPFQPTTASPHVLDVVPERFHTQGSELIVKFVLEMLEKVGQEMVGDLKANLLWGGTRRVGTLCSGTDSPMIGYGAVQQAMNTLGCNWSFAHVFACDKSPTSQRFIKTLWKDSLTHLFVECGEVASAKVGRDLLSASGVSDIPAVDDVIAGFPCQDVSSLRRSKQLNASVVKDGEKRTGRVFRDVLAYVSKTPSVQSVVLENVLGLATKHKDVEHTNLDYVVEGLENIQWWTQVFKLDPRQFALPVSRGRLWMFALPMRTLAAANMDRGEAEAMACTLMQKFVCEYAFPLSDFLLNEDHPHILHEYTRAVKQRVSEKTDVAKVQQWHEAILTAVPGMGSKEWWDPIHPGSEATAAFPGLRGVTDRQFALLATKNIDVTSDMGLRKRTAKTVDIHQSIGTSVSRDNQSVIVTPTCEIFLCSRLRKMVGYEAMMMQGMHFGPENQAKLLQQFNSKELLSLAGNAFNVYCFCATMMAKELIIAACVARAARAARPATPIQSPKSCTELTVSDEDEV